MDGEATTTREPRGGIRGWLAGLGPRRSRVLRYAVGAALGGAAGLGLYAFVGCDGGGCSITRDPYVSTMIGAVMGALVADGK